MIIYNITVKVDWSIHEDWLHWVKQEQIPAVMATAYFHKHQLVRLLHVDDSEGPTYALQYYTTSIDNYDAYLVKFSAQLEAPDRWKHKYVSFSTIMQIVD